MFVGVELHQQFTPPSVLGIGLAAPVDNLPDEAHIVCIKLLVQRKTYFYPGHRTTHMPHEPIETPFRRVSASTRPLDVWRQTLEPRAYSSLILAPYVREFSNR